MDENDELTYAKITEAERATVWVRTRLAQMGRELYKMRSGGHDLDTVYTMELYEKTTGQYFDPRDEQYDNVPIDRWDADQSLLVLVFYWSGTEITKKISLPVDWIGHDWRALEAARLEVVRLRRQTQEQLRRTREEQRKEQEERDLYFALKAKYGD